jgi:hypothetical protein
MLTLMLAVIVIILRPVCGFKEVHQVKNGEDTGSGLTVQGIAEVQRQTDIICRIAGTLECQEVWHFFSSTEVRHHWIVH